MTAIRNDSEIDLMAHLMRRAGFGASRKELESRIKIGYESTVDELHFEYDQKTEQYVKAIISGALTNIFSFFSKKTMWFLRPATLGISNLKKLRNKSIFSSNSLR